MSVIFGIKEKEVIIVAGDRRASAIDGAFISDEMQKVVAINDWLCMASAGSVAIEKAIIKDIEASGNKDNILVEDLIYIIESFYAKVVEKQCDSIYNLPFYCLIAGKGRDGKGYLYNAGRFKNGFDYKEVPMALYSPADAKVDCNQIFVKNYKLHHEDFCKRTVCEISKISNIVSSVGNEWVYNIVLGKGELIEF